MILLKTGSKQAKMRVDTFIAEQLPQLSRAFIKKLADSDRISVEGEALKAGYKLKGGENLSVDYDLSELGKIEHIDLPIIYEDEDCIVINKPAGVLSHSNSSYSSEPSVASFIRGKYKNSLGSRAGIVHRLDRATSGVMICAKNDKAMAYLQKQFSVRKVKKTYVAVVSGHLKESEAIIDMPLKRSPKNPKKFQVNSDGKKAVTKYKVTKNLKKGQILEIEPQTGRTHQLRVHLSELGHPIIGDMLYGGASADRLMLHAHKLAIILPNNEAREFTSELPYEFSKL